MDRPEIPHAADELETLTSFLDYYRTVLLDKAGGLGQVQLGTSLPPSTMTLAGVIYHLTVVEAHWFSDMFAGEGIGEPWASVDWDADRDWDWNVAPSMDPDDIFEAYRQTCDRSREIVAAAASLDQLSVNDRKGEKWSLRWILVHMIEETARHAGHADLIRESIDGEIGDFRDV